MGATLGSKRCLSKTMPNYCLVLKGLARYVREPQLRDPSPLCARRDRDDGPPGGGDARQRGGERPPDGDAHPPDASVSLPFTVFLPESERKSIGYFPHMTGE